MKKSNNSYENSLTIKIVMQWVILGVVTVLSVIFIIELFKHTVFEKPKQINYYINADSTFIARSSEKNPGDQVLVFQTDPNGPKTNNLYEKKKVPKSEDEEDDTLKLLTIFAVIAGIFSALFLVLNFLAQTVLTRAEKMAFDFEKKGEELESKGAKFQIKSENILKTASELVEKNRLETKSYTEFMFMVSSQFYPKEIRPSIKIISDLIDLWDIKRAKYAAIKLRATGDKTSLLFLEDRYNFYLSQDDTASTEAANYIKDAIDKIKLREAKK